MKIHSKLMTGQKGFSNISARKYPPKTVQYSKQPFKHSNSNERDPDSVRFAFRGKLGITMHDIIILTNFKHFDHGFGLISQTI